MTFVLLFVLELLLLFILSKHTSIQLSKLLQRVFHHHKFSGWIMAFLYLPGTLLHELAHYLMAVIVRVRAVSFTLFPKVGSDNIVLGSVGIIQSDPLRRFLIGVAPVLMGLTALLISINFLISNNFTYFSLPGLAVIYGIFTVSNTMFSSKADMEGAVKLLAFLVIIILAAYLLGFRPEIKMDQNIPLLEKAVRILFIPLVIDLIFISLILTFNYLLRKTWSSI